MKDRLTPMKWLILALLLGIGLAACGPAQDPEDEIATVTARAEGVPESEAEAPEQIEDSEEAEAPQSGEELSSQDTSFDLYAGFDEDEFETTSSGVQYIILEEGEGDSLEDGQVMLIEMIGWLDDGTEFANSALQGGPIPFLVGQSTGLPGLDESIALLTAGTHGRMIIPPELAFGESGGQGIPPNTTLIFDLTVVDIMDGPADAPQDVDEGDYAETENGVKYFDFELGDGTEVEEGQQVSVHYTGWLEDGTMFDSSLINGQPLTLALGAGQVIAGWEEGLVGMKVGGQRQLVIPPELAYGADGAGGVIPPNAILIFEIEVVEAQ